jgi:hypothetical protein
MTLPEIAAKLRVEAECAIGNDGITESACDRLRKLADALDAEREYIDKYIRRASKFVSMEDRPDAR